MGDLPSREWIAYDASHVKQGDRNRNYMVLAAYADGTLKTEPEFIDGLPTGGSRNYGTIEWMQCAVLALGAATTIGKREGCHLHYANHDILIDAGNELIAALGDTPIGVVFDKVLDGGTEE